MKIILVGDEARMRRLLALGLILPEEQARVATSSSDVGRILADGEIEIAVLDWEMKTTPAVALLTELHTLAPHMPVVVMAASEAAVKASGLTGVTQVVEKPVEVDALRSSLQRNARSTALEPMRSQPSPDVSSDDTQSTRSALMRRRLAVAAKVAPTSVNVLLLGENGTGKTRLAEYIHEKSMRAARPFVTVNCPCLQTQLLESELFGHVRGAFTGAVSDAAGLVAAAQGGTLFLDEIGELPLPIQSKLLRLIQERRYERVGEARTRVADLRIIAATNRDLAAEVAAGRFREDLYFRLNVIAIEMPPLRHRPEDIVPLAEHLLAEFVAASGRKLPRDFTEEARTALLRHPWPGNLRELRNYVERAVILCEDDRVGLDDLGELTASGVASVPQVGDFVTLAALEDAHIRCVLEKAESFVQAARLLGIDKTTLYRRRRKQGGSTVPFDPDVGASLTG